MKYDYDAIVIGAGLFGQIITKALHEQGREVLMLDNQLPGAGSKPAACLMKPSWFSSMGKDKYDPALKLLDELYGIVDLKFDLVPKITRGKPIASATVHWIPPSRILDHVSTYDTVFSIRKNMVVCDIRGVLSAPLIIVAAGIWTERLLPQYKQLGQKGAAFVWKGKYINNPFIRPWAPYKQLVAFNRGDGVWVGDGTAIKQENWTSERTKQCLRRCEDAMEGHILSTVEQPKPLLGVRPYFKNHKPCLLEEVEPGLWVASGGAKNGTVAAGYCAHIIREQNL